MSRIILIYLIIVNAAAFLVYGIDKHKAEAHTYRIPEASLLLLAVIGGSAGALIGMRVFHHKTRKRKFSIGVPVILCAQLILAWLIVFVIWQPIYK